MDITRKNTAETRQEISRTQREIDAAKRRDSKLTALFKRLYEDKRTLPAALRGGPRGTDGAQEQLWNSRTNVAQFIDKTTR